MQPSRCINQIDEVCETIEKSINQAVQKTLDQLEKDCNLILSTINHTLEQDRYTSIHTISALYRDSRAHVCNIYQLCMFLSSLRMDVSSNKSNRFNSFLCGVLGIFLPLLFILSFIISTFAPEELDLDSLVGEGLAKTLCFSTVCTYFLKIKSGSNHRGICLIFSVYLLGCSCVYVGLDS